MRKLLLLPLLLVVAACSPDEPEPVAVAIRETAEIVEVSMLPYYPYFTEWEVCEINGEVYEDVRFTYTDLGLSYIVDDVVTFRSDLQITYCQGVIVEGINR